MEKDPSHWLYRLTAREWIQAALGELHRTEVAYQNRDARAGHAGVRRAAGMALNAALIFEPQESWGRSYMDHLVALQKDPSVHEDVRRAAKLLVDAPLPNVSFVLLHRKDSDQRLIDAARTVMAHAYTIVVHYEGDETVPAPEVEEIPPGPDDGSC